MVKSSSDDSLGVGVRKEECLQYPTLEGKSSSKNLGCSDRNTTGIAIQVVVVLKRKAVYPQKAS